MIEIDDNGLAMYPSLSVSFSNYAFAMDFVRFEYSTDLIWKSGIDIILRFFLR